MLFHNPHLQDLKRLSVETKTAVSQNTKSISTYLKALWTLLHLVAPLTQPWQSSFTKMKVLLYAPSSGCEFSKSIMFSAAASVLSCFTTQLPDRDKPSSEIDQRSVTVRVMVFQDEALDCFFSVHQDYPINSLEDMKLSNRRNDWVYLTHLKA